MAKQKKRSVYNFILGVTVGGLILASGSIAGKIVLDNVNSNISEEIGKNQAKLLEATLECLPREFYNEKQAKLDQLEEQKNAGKIDGLAYQTWVNYVNSEQYKNEYIEKNYSDTYNNTIVPLKAKIEEKQQKRDKNEDIINYFSILGLSGATIGAYSSACLFNTKKYEEDENNLQEIVKER